MSAYYINIKDQQVSSVAYVNGNIPIATITNAGQSRSKGVEADSDVRPTDALTLSANFGYTDARYVAYVDSDGVQRAGDPLPFVPLLTVAASAGYTV